MNQKKIINLAILVFFAFISQGQSYLDFIIESRTGFEYNVFNANEGKRIIVDEDSVSALNSGYFQHLGANLSWKLKSKHHVFRINGKAQMEYFPWLKKANLFRPYLNTQYIFKASKTHYITFEGQYNGYWTNRLSDDSEVLRPPRAYDKSRFLMKYNVGLFKGNRIYIQGRLMNTYYVTKDDRDFSYKEYEFTSFVGQKLYDSEALSHEFSLEVDYAKRFYQDAIYDPDLDEETLKEREWIYYKFSAEYIMNLKKKFKLSLGVDAIRRNDILQNRFGYDQIQPYSKISFKLKRLKFYLKNSFAKRKYQTLKAQSDLETPLIHTYLRMSGSVYVKLNKHIDIVLRGSAIRRIRNLAVGAQSFLGYDNATISLGFKFKVF